MIFRCLIAFSWGVVYALFLQLTQSGQRLASDVTWLSVVVGIGVDLAIAFDANYLTVFLVIALSSLGIIGRSLYNESQGADHPYKAIGYIGDATAEVGNIIREIQKGLDAGEVTPAIICRVMGLAHKAHNNLREARRNVYAPGLARKQKA